MNNKNVVFSNLGKINEILVSGLDQKNNYELEKSLEFLEFNNLFFLNKYKIAKVIESNSLVERYSIFRIYPSTINIKVEKTKFLVQLKKEGKNFLLGSNGKLIKVKEFNSEIPFVFGNFDSENFFKLKKMIDEIEFDFNQIRNLFFFKSGRWDIETTDGIFIKLPKNNVQKSLEILINILNKDQEKRIKKIDLRQNNQIIING